MNQATGSLQPGINIQLVNSNINAKNDVKITVNNPDPILIHLKSLLNPVASAGHDSYEARQRSECFPDTRAKVIHDIEAWVKGESHQAAPIYILDGVAGIGKSTVAQTIANRAAALGLLGASFFFSRDEDLRTIARHFFPTIAYQLSFHDKSFAINIKNSLEQDPSAPAKLLNQQLTLLLREPFQKVLSQKNTPTLIVVDALDECEEKGAEELLTLLGQHVPQMKGLKILITSRPEAHIRDVLDQDGNHEKFCLHEIEDSIVHSDIRLYLQFRLSAEEIRKSSRHRNATWQPTDKDVEKLCGLCGTLFIIAATVIKFVLDPRFNPQKQLSRLLNGVTTSNFAVSTYNLVDSLDHTYICILCAALSGNKDIDTEWLRNLNDVLGSLITLANPLPYQALASLLELDPDDFESTLSQMHSLIAPTGNGADMTFRIHHKSFPDFITNKERIQQALKARKLNTYPDLGLLLWINPRGQHIRLAKACFRIMNHMLKWNMANIDKQDLYKDKEDIPHVRPELIPRELAYAAMHWASHLHAAQELNEDPELRMYLNGWASRHILSWMETMVILDQVNGIYGILQDAVKSLKCATDKSWTEQRRVLELLSDAWRFVQQGSQVMRISPMHIYKSCLTFVPIETSLYRAYSTTPMLKIEVGKNDRWNQLFATLVGHSDLVGSVAFSSDGSRLASGSIDNTVRLWNANTGAPLTTLTGHTNWVRSVAFSSDGSRLASGSSDKTVRLWDANTGAPLTTLTGHSRGVDSVAFSSDGLQLASGSSDYTVRLWDANTGAPLTTLTGHSRGVDSVAFSSDGSQLASGSSDYPVRLWDANTGAPPSRTTPITTSNFDISVAFSSDGSRLASGSDDNIVRVWDAYTGAPLTTFTGHSDRATSVGFSSDGSRLAFGSSDKTVRLWDANTGAPLTTLTGHSDRVRSVAFSSDGSRLASGSSDKTVRLWDANTGAPLTTLTGHSGSVFSVAFTSDGSRLASGSDDKTVRLWDANTGTPLTTLPGHSNWVISVASSSDGSRLASGSFDKTVRLWDANTGAPLTTLTGHSDRVRSVAFSSDGSRLASGSSDKTVRLWDANTGAPLTTLTGHSDRVRSVAFSSDGSRLASGSDDNTVRLWDANTGAPLTTLTGHSRGVDSVAFSSDGSRLASGSSDNTVRLWDANTGAPLTTLIGHSYRVISVAFSSNGSRLASGSFDKTVRLWDANTGAPLTTLTIPSSSIMSVLFLPNSSQTIDRVISPGSHLPWSRTIDPTSLLLLVNRENPPITGIMMVNLLTERDKFSWEIVSVCWFPPDIRVSCLSVDRLNPRFAIGSEDGRVMTLDFSSHCSRSHLIPHLSTVK